MYLRFFILTSSIVFWIFFYFSKYINKRTKYFMPFINLIFWGLLLFIQIISFPNNETTFFGMATLFFQTFSTTRFYLLLLPNIILGTVIPIIVISIYKIYTLFSSRTTTY